MSIGTVETIMGRIAAATQDSQIAVFLIPKTMLNDNQLDAKFAGTYVTKKLVDNNDPRLVGCFDCSMDSYKVREKIKAAVSGDL